jgi:hypothetical protein
MESIVISNIIILLILYGSNGHWVGYSLQVITNHFKCFLDIIVMYYPIFN